eukprot:SAG11_NODE_1533_length_4732_cov_3.368012_6_plen_91_part_00
MEKYLDTTHFPHTSTQKVVYKDCMFVDFSLIDYDFVFTFVWLVGVMVGVLWWAELIAPKMSIFVIYNIYCIYRYPRPILVLYSVSSHMHM